MIVIDASVWVAAFLEEDVHHEVSDLGLEAWTTNGGRISVPTLLPAEVAGAISRRTGDLDLATRALSNVLDDPAIEVVPLDAILAADAARLAASLRLRGADAVYGALARRLDAPLITWDNDRLHRCGGVVAVSNPSEFAGRPE